ncbi:YcnI family protein (plasmid) [Leifsonia sp. ZF2019]|uniref:YcnI family protein n=1 Tax=Leifsonia sp. ZF2019 TaxID=2781978 RepID=UPI001CBB14B7|nr:YcnI family protein [Leifsonia sp. ZF2019]UAJ81733.1 YcnI family protein [Leifsonia sp. ZF2019]
MAAPRRRRIGVIGTLAAAAAAALVLAVAGPASAHVHVDGPVTAGGYGVLTFRVPTESATASTVKLQVTFPKDMPIITVSTQPKAGWTAEVATDKLAKPEKDDDGNTIDTYISSVTWTATAGAGIKPGEFDTFAVSVGPIPEVKELTFPAAQTYSDGSVVDWNETQQGSAEPEHPAPTLAVTPATSGGSDSTSTATPMTMGGMDMSSSSGDGSGTGLGIAGLIAGVLALILAIVALVRGSRGKAAEIK